MANLNQIVKIVLSLSQLTVPILTHRDFCCFATFTSAKASEEKIIFTLENVEEDIVQIDDEKQRNYIELWFSSGGTKLTAYNEAKVEEIKEIKEGNIIFASLAQDKQLEVYKKLSGAEVFAYKVKGLTGNLRSVRTKGYKQAVQRGAEVLSEKGLYFTASALTPMAADYPKARNVYYIYTNDDVNSSVFEYMSFYNNARFFQKNNFATTKLINDATSPADLQTLKNLKYGGLVKVEGIQQAIYYNMVDSTGELLNSNFIARDIAAYTQFNMVNTLINLAVPSYTNSTVQVLEDSMAKASDYYVNAGLINNVVTSSVPVAQQTDDDKANQTMRGFAMEWQLTGEVNYTIVTLTEKR